jgi:hypothetical protein
MVLPSSASCRPAGAGSVIASARFAISDIAESNNAAAAIARQSLRIDTLLGVFLFGIKKLGDQSYSIFNHHVSPL